MTHKNRFETLALAFLMTTLGAACSKDEAPTVTVKVLNTSLNAGVVASVYLGSPVERLMSLLNPAWSPQFSEGFNTASELKQLKYIFGQVDLCLDVDTQSSFGYSAETECMTVYSNSLMTGGDSELSVADILAKYSDPNMTFDLMNAADIARLETSSGVSTTLAMPTPKEEPDGKVNTYAFNYAVVTWAPAIGVKGSVTSSTGVTLHTRAQTAVSTPTGVGSDWRPVSTVPDMTAGDEELAYVKSANGGMVTKFQKEIDATQGKTYSVDVVFNPEGVLRGCTGSTSGNISDGTRSIDVPMLPVTVVLRESSDTLMRESYTISVAATHKIRVDLYYLKSDTDKNVLAATFADLNTNTDENTCYVGDNRVFRVEKQSDATLTFYSGKADSTLLASGLVRGGTGQTITFASGYSGLPEGATTGTVTAVSTIEY